jgi:RNA polymerase sigma-70 factor (ECF subfamily)
MEPADSNSPGARPFDEVDLVRRCTGNCERAFAELVDRYKRMVYNLVDRIVCDPNVTDDVAQEVFVKVHRGLPAFRGASRLSTWIYRIAYRTCLEELAKPHRRQRFVSLDGEDGEDGLGGAEVWVGAPDEEMGRVDLREDLGHWMADLPTGYRAALTLYYLRDRKYREIAEIMALPEGTVKTYLRRAKQMLRKRILKEERATG